MAKFEFESLTLEEVELIESISNRPIDAIADDKSPKGAALSALIYVIKRREDPKFTMNDAKKFSFKDAMALIADTEEDPKDE